MVEKAKRFVNVNTQTLDLTFWYDGGINDSEGGMRGKADVFVFAVEGEAVEEVRFAWCEGKSKVQSTVEVLFGSIFQ